MKMLKMVTGIDRQNQSVKEIRTVKNDTKRILSLQALNQFLLSKEGVLRNNTIPQKCKKAASWGWQMLGAFLIMAEAFKGMMDKVQPQKVVNEDVSTNNNDCDESTSNEFSKDKYILVLDLDETLIHSDTKRNTPDDFEVKINIGDEKEIYFVRKRPYMDWFLERMSKIFNLAIFTAAVKEYADQVIDYIDPCGLIKKRLYRDSCTYKDAIYYKDLTKISPDLSKTFIIDNSPSGFQLNEQNGMQIKSWYHEGKDRELKRYAEFLEKFVGSLKGISQDIKQIIKLLKKKFPKHIIN